MFKILSQFVAGVVSLEVEIKQAESQLSLLKYRSTCVEYWRWWLWFILFYDWKA